VGINDHCTRAGGALINCQCVHERHQSTL
jgi:hypothetical protein